MSKLSLGNVWTNSISPATPPPEVPFELDHSRKIYIFDVIPMGAVRMTQSDKWRNNPEHENIIKRQRKEVTRYYKLKDDIRSQAIQMNYEQLDTLEIIFLVPMPTSWSEKKKFAMNKLPVKTRPNIDNYIKAFMDALLKEDSNFWRVVSEKRYAFKGSIIVYK